MIIAKLVGGVGNQMFQYACARNLALLHNTSLKIDISYLENQSAQVSGGITPRAYELGIFNIVEEFASPADVKRLSQNVFPKSVKNAFLRRVRNHTARFLRAKKVPGFSRVIEFNFGTDRKMDLSKLPDHIYLEGYWQKLDYITGYEQVLRKEFTFKNPFPPEVITLASEIQSCNSIGINVRRGDYYAKESVRRNMGTLDEDYFVEAANHVAKHVVDPKFYVYSDDIDWCKSTLKVPFTTHFLEYDQAQRKLEFDLYLFSKCRHNIISNGTFSWWGAWLNTNKDKMVVAPARWCNDRRERNTVNKYLIPETWVRL